MQDPPPIIDTAVQAALTEQAARQIRENETFYRVTGILAVVIGLAALVLPVFASIAAELTLGAVFAIGGIAQFVTAFQARQRTIRVVDSVLLGLLGIVAGALLLAFPLAGLLTLTVVMAGYFLVSGVIRLYFAISLRPADRWGWLLASGIASIILALVIFSGLPGTAAWALGLLLAIDFIFYGVSLLGIVSGARRILDPPA